MFNLILSYIYCIMFGGFFLIKWGSGAEFWACQHFLGFIYTNYTKKKKYRGAETSR